MSKENALLIYEENYKMSLKHPTDNLISTLNGMRSMLEQFVSVDEIEEIEKKYQ